jgi:two-component system sensor histidine kinase/response regulator
VHAPPIRNAALFSPPDAAGGSPRGDVSDTMAGDALDRLVDLARSLFDVSAACIVLLDDDRSWRSAGPGLPPGVLPPDLSFCTDAIRQDAPVVVHDAWLDPRLQHNPVVLGPPHLRFYAGAPLHGPGGFVIGAFCLLDVRPHAGFDARAVRNLAKLAACAGAELGQGAHRQALAQLLTAARAGRQAAERTLSVKTDFIETMSHEIRTPLNGIIGMTEMLLASALRDDQAYYATIMRTAAEHLGRVVNEVLDIAKLEAGAAVERPDFITLEALVAEPISVLAGNLPAGLGFGVMIAPDVPAQVAVDAMRLRQVLINLLGNALKFTREGGVWLEIDCAGPADPASDIRDIVFAVKDTGIGIALDELPRLFSRFSQLPAGAAQDRGGSGLGLAICQHLVRLMGGTITVTSTRGQGSVFAFTLPLPVRGQAAPVAAGRPVLLVEPNAVDRRVIEAQLRRIGAVPTVVADAAQLAKSLCTPAPPFEALILDEATAAQRGLASVLRAGGRLPVFLTVSARAVGVPDAEPGMRRLPKPIDPAALRAYLCPVAGPAAGPAAGPVAGPAATVAFPSPAPPAAPKSLGAAPLRILLVEDNEINQVVAAAIVRKLGHEVTIVASGVAAIGAIAAGTFDLVLMDMMMPDVDGPTTTRAIRKLRGPQATIYIIALTANASTDHQLQCQAAGMNDFLTKPVARPRLEEAIGRYRASRRA